ncbi:MAG TPA: MFS transporter [Ktedonobacteraceae bacterium]|nr:MFS transporter [Ktedonobacteraceae bacterium]
MGQTFASSSMDRRAISVLAAGHLCIDLCQGAVPALLPFLIVERHLSYAAAASLVLATSLASSVIQPLFGSLADRFAAPWFMPVGLLLAGLGLAGAGVATDFWQIVLAMMISGVGVATFHPEAARWVNLVASQKRATAMSIFSVGGNLGFAIGPLLTTGLLLVFGLRGAALLLVPLVIVSLALILSFPRLLTYHQRTVKSTEKTKPAEANAWGAFSLLTVAIICRSIVFYGLNTFLPLYWIAVLHQSKSAGALALTMVLASGAIGTLISGHLADRYGRRVVVLAGFALLTPLLLAFVTLGAANVPLSLVLLLPIGLALFAPASVTIVMGQEYLPGYIGTASGVTLGLAVSVGGITTPLFGHIADLYGVHASLVGLIFVPLLAVGATLALPRDRRKSTRQLELEQVPDKV